MPIKASGNYSFSYNAVALAAYISESSLKNVVEAIESRNLASTAVANVGASASTTISISGDWDKALDDALAPDSLMPPATLRTWAMVVGASGAQVTYAQTGTAQVGAFVSNYEATFPAGEKATWSAELTISGPVART